MSKLTPIAKRTLPTHIAQAPKDTLSKEARQCIGKYTERVKLPGEVAKRETDWRGTTYKTGDGDHTAQVPRAGSMDAYSLPSKGNRT